jgi:hypothetical protein
VSPFEGIQTTLKAFPLFNPLSVLLLELALLFLELALLLLDSALKYIDKSFIIFVVLGHSSFCIVENVYENVLC